MTIAIRATRRSGDHCQSWTLSATCNNIVVLTKLLHVYPPNWGGHRTSEQLGQDFLVWLDTARNTPTPAPTAKETGTYADFRADQKQRERFIREALKGTLTGLTHTGVEAGACLQTALFAIETAEQVLTLMDTTPLQRQVLGVLSLEQFTHWLSRLSPLAVVGSLNNQDHPVCRYLKEKGLELAFSNIALYDEHGVCVLGNDGTFPLPSELPLDLVGAWLPALLDWKTFDPDIESTFPTFTALEVLEFLQPFQR